MTNEEAFHIGCANVEKLRSDHGLQKALDGADFDGFERSLNRPLSDDFRVLLQNINGAVVGDNYLLGLGSHLRGELRVDIQLNSKSCFSEGSILPIATDGFGGFYGIVISDPEAGAIVYCVLEDDEEPTCFIASSIFHFLYFWTEKEIYHAVSMKLPFEEKIDDFYWPFDKSKVLKYDPEIARLKRYSLPWELI